MPGIASPSQSRRSLEQRLAAAEQEQRKALARLEKKNATVERYQAQKKTRERKLDTRRKIIAGALALEHMQYDPAFSAAFWGILNKYVTRLPERALFGLPIPDIENDAPK